jgi:hypothetical protein
MTENELALSYVDELKFSDFFALLRKNFGANPEISRLEQAFTLNKTDVDFFEQAKTLANKLLDKKAADAYNFNERYAFEITNAILPYTNVAQKFIEKAKNIPNWHKNPDIAKKAKELISFCFTGVLGKELGQLLAIESEEFGETKIKNYLAQSLVIVKRSLDLFNFTLISKLWHIQKLQKLSFNAEQKTALTSFFDKNFEENFTDKIAKAHTSGLPE